MASTRHLILSLFAISCKSLLLASAIESAVSLSVSARISASEISFGYKFLAGTMLSSVTIFPNVSSLEITGTQPAQAAS